MRPTSPLTPELTLVIPAYNEGRRVATGLSRLLEAGERGYLDLASTEVLYVDDGSTDDTVSVLGELVAQLPNARVLAQLRNRGKGASVRAGVAAARGKRIVFTDADLAIGPDQMPAMLAALDRVPMAIGNRSQGQHIDYDSLLRTLAGRSFNAMVRVLSGLSYRDTQCGWKGFDTAYARVLFTGVTLDRFAFDVELLALAQHLSIRVEELPVRWDDVAGSSVSVGRDSLRMLGDVYRAMRGVRNFDEVGAIEIPGTMSAAQVLEACVKQNLAAAPVVVEEGRPVAVLSTLDHRSGPELTGLAREWGTTQVSISLAHSLGGPRRLVLAGGLAD